ncbi:RdgB/HAM1 family non-canonical purine NTP pyrophosphatase [Litorivivens sp.]|uniref:RdgB/HAM1 family non-canonical purine NTP pyrophosphatase n=1 Tax=Litorivivens sp. TaxID=2020868 RepID=UPI0035647474
MTRVVLASGNRGKLKEMQQVLSDTGFELMLQTDFDIVDAEETGKSFVENALIKARHASAATGLPALADDSGLCVSALQGAPGIYSARYSGADANDASNNEKLLRALTDASDRSATFVCVLAYVRHADDPLPLIFQGLWRGEILAEGRGDNGFGYDPLFYVPELACSSAELPSEIKNQHSHRGRALALFLEQWRQNPSLFS